MSTRPLRAEVNRAVAEALGPDEIAKATSPGAKMLLALARTGKHIYEGTVPGHVKARRRARNRAARAARRITRKRS